MDLSGKKVTLTGEFDFAKRSQLELRVGVRGGKTSKGKKVDYVFAGEGATESVLANARDRGIPIIEGDEAFEALGEPLYQYRERFLERFEEMNAYAHIATIYKRFNEPASDEAIATAEAAVGAPLDPMLAAFYRQFNGITLGMRRAAPGEDTTLFEGTYEPTYPKMFFMDSSPNSRAFWKFPDVEDKMEDVGTMNIPPIEQLFDSSWGAQYGMADEDVRFGKRGTILGADIFLFDATYCYQPTYLGIDREAGAMMLTVGHDHSACLSDFDACDIESYLEELIRSGLNLPYRKFNKSWINVWWVE